MAFWNKRYSVRVTRYGSYKHITINDTHNLLLVVKREIVDKLNHPKTKEYHNLIHECQRWNEEFDEYNWEIHEYL